MRGTSSARSKECAHSKGWAHFKDSARFKGSARVDTGGGEQMEMTITNIAILLFAGIAAGLIGYLAGLASLVSYPALLAVGLPPLAANVTNTLGLVGTGLGAGMRAGGQVMSSGKGQAWQQFAVCALGGITGAVLLLVSGEAVFAAVVPWLIAFAALMLLLGPRIKSLGGGQERWNTYLGVLFVVCVYGGYFGAGAGIVYFAAVLVLTTYPWPHAVLMKSILLSISNLAASLIFIVLAPVDWLAAALMFAGNLIGGNLGPLVQRFVPETLSRWVIALGGFYLAWSLSR